MLLLVLSVGMAVALSLPPVRVSEIAGIDVASAAPPPCGALMTLYNSMCPGKVDRYPTEVNTALALNAGGHVWDDDRLEGEDEGATEEESCARITRLDFSNIQCSGGKLPTGVWSHFTRLRHFDISVGGQHGQVPPDMAYLQSLTYLDLSKNRLDGTLPVRAEPGGPSWLRHLTFFAVADNRWDFDAAYVNHLLAALDPGLLRMCMLYDAGHAEESTCIACAPLNRFPQHPCLSSVAFESRYSVASVCPTNATGCANGKGGGRCANLGMCAHTSEATGGGGGDR